MALCVDIVRCTLLDIRVSIANSVIRYWVRKGNSRQLGPDFSTKEQMSRRCSGGGMRRRLIRKKNVFELGTPGSVLEMRNPETLEECTVLALNFTIRMRMMP